MIFAIQIGGLIAAAALAVLMVRRAWRLPALVVAMLVLPGNVDNLLPQVAIDPNPIPGSMAPIVSFIDLLLGWALVLTLQESEGRGLPTLQRRLVAVGVIVLIIALASAVLAILAGVDVRAAARGIILFARIPVLLFVVFRLRDALNPVTLAVAITLGTVVLLGNGIYTTTTLDLTRFTAATFGRNGYSVVLTVCGAIAGGLGFELVRGRQALRLTGGAAALGISAAAVFGSFATGSRIGLVLLVLVVALAIFFGRTLYSPLGRRQTAAAVGGVVVIALAAAMLTPGGYRTLTITGISLPRPPVETPTAEEMALQSRSEFWTLAVLMAAERPITGFGPYQWNFERYERDPDAVVVVADAHNAYLQIAAEFGIPTLLGYLVLLVGTVGATFVTAARSRGASDRILTATVIIAAACAFPASDLTNSNLFNTRTGALMWLLYPAALVFAQAAAARLGSRTTTSTAPAGLDTG
jgi:hypothetical protein